MARTVDAPNNPNLSQSVPPQRRGCVKNDPVSSPNCERLYLFCAKRDAWKAGPTMRHNTIATRAAAMPFLIFRGWTSTGLFRNSEVFEIQDNIHFLFGVQRIKIRILVKISCSLIDQVFEPDAYISVDLDSEPRLEDADQIISCGSHIRMDPIEEIVGRKASPSEVDDILKFSLQSPAIRIVSVSNSDVGRADGCKGDDGKMYSRFNHGFGRYRQLRNYPPSETQRGDPVNCIVPVVIMLKSPRHYFERPCLAVGSEEEAISDDVIDHPVAHPEIQIEAQLEEVERLPGSVLEWISIHKHGVCHDARGSCPEL